MMFVERTLPALASASTVNESVPLKVPLPAVTSATSVFDDVAGERVPRRRSRERERGGAERRRGP